MKLTEDDKKWPYAVSRLFYVRVKLNLSWLRKLKLGQKEKEAKNSPKRFYGVS